MRYSRSYKERAYKGKDRGTEQEQPITLDPKILLNLYNQIVHDAPRRPLSDMVGIVHQSDAYDYLTQYPDNSVDFLFTDEPFGQPGHTFYYNGANRKQAKKPIIRNFDWDGKLPAHLTIPWVWEVERILKPGGAFLNCGLASWNTTFQNICRWSGLTLRAHIVFLKTNPMRQIHPGSWRSGHEMIWIASKGTLADRMRGKTPQELRVNYHIETRCPECGCVHNHIDKSNYKLLYRDYSELGGLDELPTHLSPFRDGHSRVHDTQKPSWMSKYYTDLFTKEGDLVVDPFAGSGELLLAAASNSGLSWGANDKKPENAEIIRIRLSSTERTMFNNETTYLPKVSGGVLQNNEGVMSFMQDFSEED